MRLWILCAMLAVVSGETVRIVEGTMIFTDPPLPPVTPNPLSGPPSLHFLAGQCFTNTFDRHDYTVCPFHNITSKRSIALQPSLLGVWGEWLPVPVTDTDTAESTEMATEKDTDAVRDALGGADASTSGDSDSTQSLSFIGAFPQPQTQHPQHPQYAYTSMHYTKGKSCNHADTTTTLMLKCEHSDFELLTLTSNGCKYNITLGLPIACHLMK
mmetsp:Transcript_5087/g.11280  ORF Transcript_5087/g.11280 Transcript_5087/m.11280 type:complete len:213 (-) Transcript_5087:123-761(-)